MPDERCPHSEPYEGYVAKKRRGRYFKGKHYTWVPCAGCNVIFLGVALPQEAPKQ